MRLAVFISGGGTNLQALIEGERDHLFRSKIVLVLSSNPNAYGIKRGRNAGIPTFISKNEEKILDLCNYYKVEGIVLAGYLQIVTNTLLIPYKNKIINIHPSLLPKYGGLGMYGMKVHEKVFENKERYSGATVHMVTEEVDGGKMILQEAIDISNCKNPKEIQEKVLTVEHNIFPKGIKIWEASNETCID
ncbi:MAG: phosphoribosylglycinamide formyltransferase [Tissierellia bacterium]|nr:phosphoribosylglycinamide formyltransferase [Tissierellia bacterium]